MPTYDYLCEQCRHRFDAWQKITDEPIVVCPECGGHVHRVIHPVGLVFKGGGFYSTDTRSAAAKPAPNEASSESASASEAKSENAPAKAETKTETKTETKSETKTDSKPGGASGGTVAAAS